MRILIVDDHAVVRRGVRDLLEQSRTVEVCGEAVDGRDAVAKASELKPDAIVMDISMPNLNGLEATREIRSAFPEIDIVILTQHDSPEMMRQARSAGARGYVVKSAISADLITCLWRIRQAKAPSKSVAPGPGE
jgi:DNA-binding NarL/FixJ family response regulator